MNCSCGKIKIHFNNKHHPKYQVQDCSRLYKTCTGQMNYTLVFEPFLVESVEIQSSVPSVPAASKSPAPSGAGEDEFTVESIKKKRVKLGQVQYLVKWAG